MSKRLDICVCPKCRCGHFERIDPSLLECSRCGQRYSIWEGIPVLLVNQEPRSKLNDIDYDTIHRVSTKRAKRLYDRWSEVLNLNSVRSNDVLEIGAGTGMLTYGLVSWSPFKNIYVTDISYTFIRTNNKRIPESDKNVFFYICDANELPFKESIFDAIVGNSILHHLLDYHITLQKCYKLLRSGGLAIFTEPIREGHVILAFFAALIREIQLKTGLNIFDKHELEILNQMSKNVTKHLRLTEDNNRISKLEDKYIFGIDGMKKIAEDIGFGGLSFYNMANPITSHPIRGYRAYFIRRLKRFGIDVTKIKEFDYIFDCFAKTFSDAIGDQLVTPFGFFVFKK